MKYIHAALRRLRNSLSYVTRRWLLFGSALLLAIVIGALVVIGHPLSNSARNASAIKTTRASQKVKTGKTASPAATTQTPIPTTPAPASSKAPATSQPQASTKTAQPPRTTGGTILPPAHVGPAGPGVQLQPINSGQAHYITIYAYNLMSNDYEFVVHPVHSQYYTSDFYVSGYLNVTYSNSTAEPDQILMGNPAFTIGHLYDGDVYILSVCSYDSGTCGVTSSNTVTVTITVTDDVGGTEYIYTYS